MEENHEALSEGVCTVGRTGEDNVFLGDHKRRGYNRRGRR